jgi:Na+-translocating ferredoxin:NAD+ oxidoreductase RNF subunit RnfB
MNELLTSLLLPAAIFGALSLVFGVLLAYAAKVFEVKVNPKITEVRAALPGANCGACGFPGCDGLAVSIAEGRSKPDACPVGGEATASTVAVVMGVEMTNTVSYVARVACGGLDGCTRQKYQYEGMKSCTAAAALHNGPKACAFGCLGFGDCVAACPFGAITIVDGIAKIVEANCKSCEKCVAACPKKLIGMVPRGKNYLVACKSTQRGPVVKKNCDVGCIGCGICVKKCPSQAITMANNLAKIDPLLCTNCGECVKVCPTNAIIDVTAPVVLRKTATAT